MKTLRVFESFAGVGSQRMALRNIGVNFEIVGISEIDKNAILAYDAIHENQNLSVPEKTKEEMMEELQHAHVACCLPHGRNEIPQTEVELKRLYTAHKRSKNFGDITTIQTEDLPDMDLFTYSFPCTNISICGKQAGFKKGSGTSSSLVWECERIIRAKKPKYLMMENVKNICSKSHMEDFQAWINLLNDIGYRSIWKVLNANQYGVPQNRERVIMLSILGEGDITFPEPIGNLLTLKDILEERPNHQYIAYYDGEIPPSNPTRINRIDIVPKVKVRKYPVDIVGLQQCLRTHKKYSNREIATKLNKPISLVEHWFRTDKYFAIPSPDIWYALKELLEITTTEFDASIMEFIIRNSVYDKAARCYFESGIAPTITASSGNEKIITANGIRRLTSLECWRLQGYLDEDYYKAKEIGQLAEQRLYERAGNGIAVPMLEALFRHLFADYISCSNVEN